MAFTGFPTNTFLRELRREAGTAAVAGRVIIAHLGNGASMAAIEGGRSLDTTMGLTPTGGLVMGTRAGDLDPGVMLYLLQEKGMSPDDAQSAGQSPGGPVGGLGHELRHARPAGKRGH